MEYPRKLKDSRTLRVFFSSPFGGMEDEREELTRKYFPQIHHFCNAKGLQFVAVDMRWGITTDAADKAQVINICLGEIDRSDLFVGFFGQRYGWQGVDDKLLQRNFDNSVLQYPWLDNYRDKSVTELEFLHGHLNNPGTLPTCIYFRDKAYDNKVCERAKQEENKKMVFKYSPDSELAPELMDNLKKRVQETEEKTIGLKMSYSSPEQGAKLMFEAIWKHLNDVLLADQSDGDLGRRESLALQHNAYLSSHLGLYLGGDEYLRALDGYMESDDTNAVVVTGAAGSGKSALVANWLDSLRLTRPQTVLLYHFVGKADQSTGISTMLERLADEANHFLSGADETSDNPSSETLDDLSGTIRAKQERLLTALKALSDAQHTVVMVIDGLDKLDAQSKIGKPLFWLPTSFPDGVFVLLSTADTDNNVNELVENRNYSNLEMKPLSMAPKRELCVKTLEESGKELSTDQLHRVVDSENTSNPLYLKIVLSELCVFGYFRLLDEKIDSLIGSPGVLELFELFLKRLEDDYNVAEYNGNLVKQIMLCIHFSYQGISENELVTMFSIPAHVWSPLYFAIEKFVIVKSGLMKFAFEELDLAVTKKYVTEETSEKYLRCLIAYFEQQKKALAPDLLITHSSTVRLSYELPHLWMSLGDKEGLAECLLDLFVFHRLYNEMPYTLFSYWKFTEYKGMTIALDYIKAFDLLLADLYAYEHDTWKLMTKKAPGEELLFLMNAIDEFLNIGNFQSGREVLLKREIELLDNLQYVAVMTPDVWNQTNLAAKYSLACVYVNLEDYVEGERMHKEVLELKLKGKGDKVPHTNDIAVSYHGLGVCHMKNDQYEEAEEWFNKSVVIHKELNQRQQISEGITNLATLALFRGEHDKALGLYEEVDKIYKDVYFGELPPVVGELMTNMALCYRRLNNLEKAQEIYERSVEIKKNAVGPDHPTVALAMINMGTVKSLQENFEKSEEYNMEAVRIYEFNDYPADHSELLMARENVVLAMINQGKQEAALPIFWAVFNALDEKNAIHKCLPHAQLEMVRYLMSLERYDEAERVLLVLMSSDKVRQDGQFVCLDLIDLERPEDERTDRPYKFSLDFGLELWPESTTILVHYVTKRLIPADDSEKILRLTNACHEKTDYKDKLYQAVVEFCWEAQKWEMVRQISLVAVKIYPENLELVLFVAKGCRQMKQYGDALPYAKMVVDMIADNPTLWNFAGETAALAGELDTAERYFKKIVEIVPEDAIWMEKVENALTLINDSRNAELQG